MAKGMMPDLLHTNGAAADVVMLKSLAFPQRGTASWTRVVRGVPESKANSRRLGRDKAGVSRLFKSSKALRYEKDFTKQLPAAASLFQFLGPVKVELYIYYPDWRRDLDESLILDLLQGRAYKNDRQVVEKIVRRFISEDARAVIRVTQVEHPQWKAK